MHIQAKNLQKSFGSKQAVSDISVNIEPGKILALLGPNGAGKSTTIKMLTGDLEPDGGVITIDGKDYKNFPFSLRSRLGVMPQEVIIWDDLTIQENLQFSSQIYKLPRLESHKRIQTLIQDLKLEPELKTLARDLSGGYKRRLNLAISIIHNPEVIFLDEPTPGIDAQSRILLTEYIQTLVKTGQHSVVLTDHYLEEAEKLADYVVIIDSGKVVAQGTVPQLKREHGHGNILQVDFDSDQELTKAQSILEKEFGEVTIARGSLTTLVSDAAQSLNLAVKLLEKHDIPPLNIHLKQSSLEDIFLLLTGKSVRE
jgi:ABC-2 type transport system ATP-binding protein